MRVLVTGATGFVGRAVCLALRDAGHDVSAVVRTLSAEIAAGCEPVVVGEIHSATRWRDALNDIDAVVHLAARTHESGGSDAMAAYREINVEGSASLARAAINVGARAFIYMSSIKANGECSPIDANGFPRRLSGDDDPSPTTPYGRSKWEAEQVLREIFQDTDVRLVVMRPPLIYGPGQTANLARLMAAVDKGVPLPFARLDNRRSFIDVGNLAAAVVLAVAADCKVRGTYTLADIDLSTEELVRAMASALGTRARLFPCPLRLLKVVAWLTRRSEYLNKITGSLIVDSERIANALGWAPARTLAESLEEAAASFRAAGNT